MPDYLTAAQLGQATRRALAAYAASDAVTRDQGREWYPLMGTLVDAMALDYGLDPRRVAGATAALSPQISVAQNLRAADLLCAAYTSNGSTSPSAIGQTYARIGTALQCLDGDLSPMEWHTRLDGTPVRAQKTRSFYRNIMAHTDHATHDDIALDPVTIDIWMSILLLGYRPDRQPGDGLYRDLAQSVRNAAARVGETPTAMQAILWITTRGRPW